MQKAFFNPNMVRHHRRHRALPARRRAPARNAFDPFIVDDVRNFLVNDPLPGSFDLAALNIQRGRDNGLPGYNELRSDYGLTPKANIAAVNPNPQITRRLSAAYTDVNDIDPWVGGISEPPFPGAVVGELARTVIAEQFTRSRDGDRFFYLNTFPQKWVDTSTGFTSPTSSCATRRSARRRSRRTSSWPRTFRPTEPCPRPAGLGPPAPAGGPFVFPPSAGETFWRPRGHTARMEAVETSPPKGSKNSIGSTAYIYMSPSRTGTAAGATTASPERVFPAGAPSCSRRISAASRAPRLANGQGLAYTARNYSGARRNGAARKGIPAVGGAPAPRSSMD